MDAKKVIKELKRKYPGKKIILNDPKNPTEILCEVEPASEHPKWSRAISVIDKTIPHFHLKTTEDYEVINGKLILTVEGKDYELVAGQSFVIKPGEHHSAKGDETWVECRSTPGWIPEDHLLLGEE
jgi:mannose-6-phosphate isomerase-like protein (cupin superfamily)